MHYSIDMNFIYPKDNLVALHFKYDFWHMTATAGSDVVQSGVQFSMTLTTCNTSSLNLNLD